MRLPFNKEITFLLSEENNEKSVLDIFPTWKEGKEHGEIKLLKIHSDKKVIFRYINSLKEGQFNIEVKKEDNLLKMRIKETLLGFFIPFLVFSSSIFFAFNNTKGILLLFSLGLFFLCLNYLSFLSKAKDIQKKTEQFLQLYPKNEIKNYDG